MKPCAAQIVLILAVAVLGAAFLAPATADVIYCGRSVGRTGVEGSYTYNVWPCAGDCPQPFCHEIEIPIGGGQKTATCVCGGNTVPVYCTAVIVRNSANVVTDAWCLDAHCGGNCPDVWTGSGGMEYMSCPCQLQRQARGHG
jgi:hypothetical protein